MSVFLLIMIAYMLLCCAFLLYKLCNHHSFNREHDVEICHDKLREELETLQRLHPNHFYKGISIEEVDKILSTISIDIPDNSILKQGLRQ